MSPVRHTLYAWLYVTISRITYVKSPAPTGFTEATWQDAIVQQLIGELTNGTSAYPGKHVVFDNAGKLAKDICTWVGDSRLNAVCYSSVAGTLHAATSAPWPTGSSDHPNLGELDNSLQLGTTNHTPSMK
jgi:hypothetical protein